MDYKYTLVHIGISTHEHIHHTNTHTYVYLHKVSSLIQLIVFLILFILRVTNLLTVTPIHLNDIYNTFVEICSKIVRVDRCLRSCHEMWRISKLRHRGESFRR